MAQCQRAVDTIAPTDTLLDGSCSALSESSSAEGSSSKTEVDVIERTLQRRIQESPWSQPFPGMEDAGAGVASFRGPPRAKASPVRELPDVTGFLVVVLVTLGLFIVPVGATIMQGPTIVASLLSR